MGLEGGERKDGSPIRWTLKDLITADAALSLLPPSMYRYDRRFALALRQGEGEDGKLASYGRTKDDMGVLQYYDPPEKYEPDKGPIPTIAHEVGHRVHSDPANRELFEQFIKATGWVTNVTDSQMQQAGLSESQIANLRATSQPEGMSIVDAFLWTLGGHTEGTDGLTYFRDKYKPGVVVARPPDALLTAYARTHYKEHFAEYFMYAVTDPESLVRVLIDMPAEALAPFQSPGHVNQANEVEFKAAQQKQADQRTVFDIYRKIFRSDVTIQQAVERLRSRGVAPERISDFQLTAARLFTPVQIAQAERTAMKPNVQGPQSIR